MCESSNDNLTVFVSQLSYNPGQQCKQAANQLVSRVVTVVSAAGRLAVLFLMDVVLKL